MESHYTIEDVYRFAKYDNIDELRRALDDKYVYTNWYVSEKGDTALHWIAMKGLTEIAEKLINKGIPINKTDKHGFSALHMACNSLLKNTDDLVSLLITKGININCKENIYGRTALLFAVKRNHTKIVRILLENGAEIDVRCKSNQLTALQIASLNGFHECVEMLLDYGASINLKKENHSALHISAFKGYANVVKLLLDRGAEIDDEIINYEMNLSGPGGCDCRELILVEVQDRCKRAEFDSFINNYIEYRPYINSIYNICYPSNIKVAKPPIGWVKAEDIRDKYYFEEIFFYLHMHIANCYSNKLLGISSVSMVSSTNHFTRNSDKTSTLMTILTDSLKLMLQPTFQNKVNMSIERRKKHIKDRQCIIS